MQTCACTPSLTASHETAALESEMVWLFRLWSKVRCAWQYCVREGSSRGRRVRNASFETFVSRLGARVSHRPKKHSKTASNSATSNAA